MKFSFEVGQTEKHLVEFQWSKWLGVARIWVDSALILKSQPLAYSDLAQLAGMRSFGGQVRYLGQAVKGRAALQMIRGWGFEVGSKEKHAIRIEKERPLILPAIRPNIYRVFIDGQLASEYSG
jgi:hypothetical protein